MRGCSWILTVVVILLLNAGITMALINAHDNGKLNTESFFSKPKTVKQATQILNAERENTITRAVTLIEPAVVSVNVIKTEIVRGGNPFGFPFFEFAPIQRQVQAIGSGVIFDPNGYIITNSHVVIGATQIKVILPDKREFDASITGIDQVNDIAVIKITGVNIPYAKLGKSDNLIIGEWSIALGNPYGFLMKDSKPSVSVGVISAVNRNLSLRQDGRSYKNMIQTDAAINQGNSGGPLVNINGEVIGINTFIVSETGGNIGLGFAIPINRVKQIIQPMLRR